MLALSHFAIAFSFFFPVFFSGVFVVFFLILAVADFVQTLVCASRGNAVGTESALSVFFF